MTSSSRVRTPIAYYGADAEAFAARYDAARFDEVHTTLLAHLPAAGAAVLDVGAGSGRDALALARLGYRVVAAEPTAALRRHAQAMDVEGLVDWVDDRLPNLSRLRGRPDRYAFILCSAVLMHVSPSELAKSFAALSALSGPDGVIAISVRAPLPGEPRQVFHDHDGRDLVAAARTTALHLVAEAELNDSLGRPDIRWRTLVFGRPPNSRKSA